jgi:hypothetical protein
VPPASWSLPPVAATKIHWRAALAKSPDLEAIYLKLLRSAANLAVSDETLCCAWSATFVTDRREVNPPGSRLLIFVGPVPSIRNCAVIRIWDQLPRPGTGLVPVGQAHFRCGQGAVQAMGAGATVEFGDEVPGGGEHDGVEPSRPGGSPSVERVFGGSGEVADMHATML